MYGDSDNTKEAALCVASVSLLQNNGQIGYYSKSNHVDPLYLSLIHISSRVLVTGLPESHV